MSLDLGSVVGGRYHLTRHIASGGMGRVWEAHDDVLDRVVAVKVLHPQYSQDDEFVGRFRSEARLTAKVQHANVATVYDYGEMHEGGDPLSYLVMEFVPGEALSDVLKRVGRLPQRHTLDMLEQTARALQAAHEIGLVHRDVKPGNIMITPSGQVKLTDFGIAKAMGDAAMTQTGMVIGTAHYIAPEQAVGKNATPAGDVYSLAVVGYECLAGRRPFNAEAPLAVAMSHVKDEPPPLPDDVPEPLQELIHYGMAKDPASRYRNGAEFATAIAAVKAGHRPIPPQGYRTERDRTEQLPGVAAATQPGPVHHSPMRPPQPAPPRASSAPRAAGSSSAWIWMLAGLLFVVAIGIAVAVAYSRDSEPAAPAPSPRSTPVRAPASEPQTTEPRTTEPLPAPPIPSTSGRSFGDELSSLTSEFRPPRSAEASTPNNDTTGNTNGSGRGNDTRSGDNAGGTDGGAGGDDTDGTGTGTGGGATGASNPAPPRGVVPGAGLGEQPAAGVAPQRIAPPGN